MVQASVVTAIFSLLLIGIEIFKNGLILSTISKNRKRAPIHNLECSKVRSPFICSRSRYS